MVHYIFTLFAIIFATSPAFADSQLDEDIMSCLELFQAENIEKSCCNSMEMFIDDVEECKTEKSEELTCEDSKCILDKYGLINGDNIDEKKTEEILNDMLEDYPNEKAMVERVKQFCLNGKFERYPPKEACTAIKFQICAYINSLVECPTWKQDNGCDKMAESATKCKTVLDKILKV